jgi:peptidoglycan hydrolase-like protein with peptidoglycan-binding domain
VEIALTPEGVVLESGPRKTLVADSLMDMLQSLAVGNGGSELFVIRDGRLLSISLAAALGILRDVDVPVAPPDRDAQAAPPAAPPIPDPPEPLDPPVGKVQGAEEAAPLPDATTKAAPPPPREAPAPPSSAKGPQDEAIYDPRVVQKALANVLGESIAADGVIGPRSRAAIARWQTGIGSTPTGYLSPNQLGLLLAEVAE